MEVINCIEITPICNWNCSYCIAGTQRGKYKDFSHEQFMKLLDMIKNMDTNDGDIVISGGEPGMVRIERLVALFDILIVKDCNIYINTNGTIIPLLPKIFEVISEKYSKHQINLFKRRLLIRLHLFESVTDFNNMKDDEYYRFDLKINNLLSTTRNLGIEVECQILYTNKDYINYLEKAIKWYSNLVYQRTFKNYPLIISPVYSSDKNKDNISDLLISKINIIKLMKLSIKAFEENDLDITESFHTAFREALGETKVKYKLHEHTMAWKGIKNEY